MEEEHKEKIRQNRVKLVQTLYMDTLLLDYLEQEKTISAAMKEDIEAEKTKSGKASKLLTLLTTRGRNAFKNFISSLVVTEQEHLALLLDPEGKYFTPQEPITTEDAQGGKQSVSFIGSQGKQEEGLTMLETGFVDMELKCVSDETDVLMKQYFNFPPRTVYKMNSAPRGRALIIVNDKYGMTGDGNRGREFDQVNMENLLDKLGYQIQSFTNLTSEELHSSLSKESQEKEHELLDSFVCVIVSYGNEKGILCIDNVPVPIDAIVAYFDAGNCPQLCQKPKVFIIQADQGIQKDRGIPVIAPTAALTMDKFEAAVNKLKSLQVDQKRIEDFAKKKKVPTATLR